MNEKIRLGVSGEAGSFSEQASMLYVAKTEIDPILHYLIDMEGVLSAIANEEVSIGVIPVFNTRGGIVTPAFEAMGKYSFVMIDEIKLDVKHSLLGLSGSNLSSIKKIASHPQALIQCDHYLQTEFSHAEKIKWIDTAKAAKDLAEGKLPEDCAVIAPKRAAEIYGLDVLAENIQGSQPNITTFIVVKRQV